MSDTLESVPTLPAPIVPATARGEATRRRLLDAAEQEFGQKGFHSASVTSITSQAGVGQGTFYLYFRSKDEIFSTLVQEIGRTMRYHIASGLHRGDSALAALRGGIDAFLQFAQQHPGLFRVVQESQFVDAAAYRAYYEHLVEGYSAGLRIAEARGELPPGDPEVRTWAVIGIVHFLGLRYCLWQGQLPDARVLEEVTRFAGQALGLKFPARPADPAAETY